VGGGLGGIALLVVALLLGADPGSVLEQVSGPQGGPSAARPASAEEEELKQFVSVVLHDTEEVWHKILPTMGRQYREPKLVLFTGQVSSACGRAGAAVGPFYCSADERVYIDLSFYHELKSRFRAPGDFAQAYVIAHEIGHHVQNLLGISGKVHSMQSRMSQEQGNQLSVRLELQADFLAGVWAHYAEKKGLLEGGDLEEALRAASAIGDDKIQMQSQGYVVPDSFTHGTSEQRIRWFQKGFQSGDMSQSDTFGARSL
jgi:predicted metalloprotease